MHEAVEREWGYILINWKHCVLLWLNFSFANMWKDILEDEVGQKTTLLLSLRLENQFMWLTSKKTKWVQSKQNGHNLHCVKIYVGDIFLILHEKLTASGACGKGGKFVGMGNPRNPKTMMTIPQ